MLSYWKNHSQRVNVNKTLSSREEIIAGVTQDSKLEPLIKTHFSKNLTNISEWFTENFMVLNPDNSHYMCLGKY